MRFYKGKKVEFISGNKKLVGEIKGVFRDIETLIIKVGEGELDHNIKFREVVDYVEPELPVVPQYVADLMSAYVRELFTVEGET